VLVEQYKRLRTDDAAPGSATAYRITVRQLEALVRLSEALARVHCSETILPSYVREVRAPLCPVTLNVRPLDSPDTGLRKSHTATPH
jgi:DNA replication licensing factor MCM6